MIVFANKPSVGVYNLEDDSIDWCHNVNDQHELFKMLQATESFDYYFMNQILLISLPNCSGRYKCLIGELEIDCYSNVLLMFHYEEIEGLIIATSLMLPEFEYIRKNLMSSCIKEVQ